MKKILSLLSATAILLSVCGCGTDATKLPEEEIALDEQQSIQADESGDTKDLIEFNELFSSKLEDYAEYANSLAENIEEFLSDVQTGKSLDSNPTYTNIKNQFTEWCNYVDYYPEELIPDNSKKMYKAFCDLSEHTKTFFKDASTTQSIDEFTINISDFTENATEIMQNILTLVDELENTLNNETNKATASGSSSKNNTSSSSNATKSTPGSSGNSYKSNSSSGNVNKNTSSTSGSSYKSNSSSGSSGGEFYCMGKNDTCPNKTYSPLDLFCDSCDPDGDNIEG
ncbi:MAG: hypothetical protein J1F63_05460 [Oscillospiraceae bacterium]|nr:hypothetical protein [Oscillospiraceae bacterium]